MSLPTPRGTCNPAGVTPRSHATVLGVDGCRGGWIAARVHVIGGQPTSPDPVTVRFAGFASSSTLADIVANSDALVIAVDIPIGLPGQEGSRDCDRLARQVLRPHGSRVFAAPVRASLAHIDDYAAACTVSRAMCGKALSKQAWHILGKIAEADVLADDPRMVECHPEVAFALMGGGVIAEPKRTREGRRARLDLVASWLPDLADADVPRGDDALDALACAWSATRILTGAARQWPTGEPPRDARDRPMRIVA